MTPELELQVNALREYRLGLISDLKKKLGEMERRHELKTGYDDGYNSALKDIDNYLETL